LIHPSAIIHPRAELGREVSVGPYAVIEGAARIGDRCTIQAHAVIGESVEIGEDNLVGYGSIIGSEPQDLSFRSEIQSHVKIGRGNRIREYVTIHRGSVEDSATVVGDNCYLMSGAHLAHNVRVGSHAIIANNSLLGGYVEAGDRVFVGGGCVFHQHIRIGRLAICQGGSAFSKDIPPFVTAAERNGVAGLNTIGLRRAGFTAAQRAEIKAAFDLLFRSGLNVTQAVATAGEQVWGEEGREFWDFVSAASKRGLVAPLSSRARVPTQSGDDED
jgi:UDP-N-acetylglucosamine acyltransferase